MDSSSNATDCKHFVLVNIPASFEEDDVLDYVEGTLDIDVTEVKMSPPFPRKALVFLKNTLDDFGRAVQKIEQAPIGSVEVKMLPTHKLDAVVVNEYDPQDLSEDYLQMYFESTFANGESVVKSCHVLKELRMAVIYFHAEFRKVVDKILKTDRHMPLPSMNCSIVVSPCFHNFNDIQQGDVDSNGDESDDEESDSDDKTSASEETDSYEEENSDIETADSDDDHHDNRRNDPLDEPNRQEKVDLKRGKFLHAKHVIGIAETKAEINHCKVKKGNAHTEENLSSSSESDSSNRGYSSSDEADDIEIGQAETKDEKIFNKSKDDKSSETEEDELWLPQHAGDSHNSKTSTSDDSDDSSSGDEKFFHADDSNTNRGMQENIGSEEIKYKCQNTSKVKSRVDEMTENITSGIYGSDQLQSSANRTKSGTYVTSVKTTDGEKPKKTLQVHKPSQRNQAIHETFSSKLCQKSLPMSKAQAHFLQPIFASDHKGFKVYFDKKEGVAMFIGEEESIDECYLEMQKAQRNVKEKRLKLTEATKSVLTRKKGKTYLQSFKERGAYVYLTDSELIIAAVIEDAFQSTCKSFEAKINCKETRKSDVEIPAEELKSLKHYLEAELLVSVQLAENQKEIYIEGVKDDIFVSMKKIEELLNRYSEHEKIFEVVEDKALYLYSWCRDKLEYILKSVKTLEKIVKRGRVFIKFHGDKVNAETAYQELRSLEKELTTEKTDLKELFKDPQDQKVINQFFLSGTLKQHMQSFEIANKCVVTFALSSDISNSPLQEDHPSPVFSSKAVNHLPPKMDFNVTATCKLVIKANGDVTQEKSDVLVCPLDNTIDLRKTRVGISFNKSVPNLWRKLKAVHNSNRDAAVLTVLGPFETKTQAKAICHVIFSKWDPNSSKDQLTKAVTDVLDQAMKIGANSVSFPPMGFGKAFGFPAPDVSRIILATIKSVMSGKDKSSLNEIILLAPDEKLFSEFTIQASKNFTDPSSPVLGATGGVVPNNDTTESRDDDSDLDTDDENFDNNLQEAMLTFDIDHTCNLKVSVTYLKSGETVLTWQKVTDYQSTMSIHRQFSKGFKALLAIRIIKAYI